MAVRTKKKVSRKKTTKRKATRKAATRKTASRPARRKVWKPKEERSSGTVTLLVGTRKGGFFLKSDRKRQTWRLIGPHFLGSTVHHMVLDPRDGKTLLAAVRTGHLGPTVFRSTNMGRTWTEAKRPPQFKRAKRGKGRSVNHVFWFKPGLPSERGVWYAGTSPHGLFRTEDGGRTWKPINGFNEHEDRVKWTGGEKDGTPDGPKLHSIQVDPRDGKHLYVGLSSGGVFESTNAGRDWKPLNKGCAMPWPVPEPPEYGHDPHCMALHPMNPDVLYQQNHAGIYRMVRGEEAEDRWVRIGDHMPRAVGDIGFPMVLHPRDVNTVWVWPMDGTSVWPRTSPGGKPAAYVSRDGGRRWTRCDKGLPRAQAWFSVKRQCMTCDAHDPVGVYAGTSSGEIYGSRNEGRSWRRIAAHLPHVYAVEVAGRMQ